MTKEKTLKDIEKCPTCKRVGEEEYKCVQPYSLKQEAIKWIKKDKEQIKADERMPQPTRMLLNYLTTRWMKRLDITEDDLKEAHN